MGKKIVQYIKIRFREGNLTDVKNGNSSEIYSMWK